MDHAPRSGGSVGVTAISRNPAAAASRSAAAATTVPTSSRTWAIPRSTTMAAVKPDRSWLPRPVSHPSTLGRLSGSRRSKPLQQSKYRAVSRTERVRQPSTVVIGSMVPSGPFGIRPYVAFNPKRPLKPAGPRMEPPPSLPVAIGKRPPATAAAVPPEDPPGVRSGFHGFRVVPCRTVEVQLMPPNSGAVV